MPRWRQYWVLTKPRVTLLAVFCAVIGMFLVAFWVSGY
jgi:protoheme IX farnesyltransferase